MKIILFCTAIILFFSCSLDYSDVYITEDLSEDIPDSVLYDFAHTSVQKGNPVFTLGAKKALVFNKKKETRLENIRFQEFSAKGEIITEGQAAEAIFFTETEDAEFWGNLLFYSLTEEATFTTDYLYWNNEDRKLTGKEEVPLRIQRDSGTHIEGIGFEAEALSKSVTFSGPVQGMYITENDEDGQE